MEPEPHKDVPNRKAILTVYALQELQLLCYTFLLKTIVLEIVMILQEILEPVVCSRGLFIVLSVMVLCPQFSFCGSVPLHFVSANI